MNKRSFIEENVGKKGAVLECPACGAIRVIGKDLNLDLEPLPYCSGFCVEAGRADYLKLSDKRAKKPKRK